MKERVTAKINLQNQLSLNFKLPFKSHTPLGEF